MQIDLLPEVFNDVYLDYLEDTTPTQIMYGGASSGKSVFLAQRVVFDLIKGGRNYLVCREVGRTVRGSVAMEIGKVISSWNVSQFFNINKTDGTITCTNGYQCVFTGLDDVEKIKSITPAKGVFTDVWCEEATEMSEASIGQLVLRQRGGSEDVPKRLMLSFNPILQTSWIYTKYFKNIGWADDQKEYKSDELLILKTTYKDNKFLTKQDIYRRENETDKYRYDVYSLGNWGILGSAIFRNWRVEDLSGKSAQFTNHKVGLDFGYSSDPAAVLVSHYDRMRKTVYVYDELYETGLTNDILADRVKGLIETKHICCDSAEPKSIAELQKYGVNAYGAKKGKDSVLHGIQWLQQQQIVIDSKCINMRNELMTYKWKEDKGGNALPVPIDQDNHLIDALRYAYEDESLYGLMTVIENPFD
jgi:phage terminase large subunit